MKKNQKYAVIDIETTGGLFKRDKITEIGIVTVQNGEIIDEWQTLVHPERSIPDFITRITGITDQMVADAPKFYEVAKELVERTKDTVFVAHNVRFDYSFIQYEFKRLGYSYSKRKLCTCNLTRKCVPGLKSYSLKNLSAHYNIPLENHHRALDDARAAAEILMRLLDQQNFNEQSNTLMNRGVVESRLPASITLDDLHQIPEAPGVYYFYDRDDALVYIGKSKHIQKRIMEHFAKTTRKAEKLQSMVHRMDYVLTGNELHAMLLESEEIKRHLPPMNKAQRKNYFPYHVVAHTDESAYYHYLSVAPAHKKLEKGIVIKKSTSQKTAKKYIEWITAAYGLCLAVNGISVMGIPCRNYHIEKCFGACIQEEPAEDYNERFAEFLADRPHYALENFAIIDQGRSLEERAVTVIQNGDYYGHGYIDAETSIRDVEDILEQVPYNPSSEEINSLIGQYLNGTSKSFEIIEW